MSNEERATKTTIGPTIVIRGKLKSDEDLIVKGRIDAEIKSSRALFVENSGIVKANVDVHSLRVNGILVGNIAASEKAEIASDGRVVGDIEAPRLVIADGAAFRGRVDMPTFGQPSRRPAPAAGQAGPDKSKAAKPEAAKPADAGAAQAKPAGAAAPAATSGSTSAPSGEPAKPASADATKPGRQGGKPAGKGRPR